MGEREIEENGRISLQRTAITWSHDKTFQGN